MAKKKSKKKWWGLVAFFVIIVALASLILGAWSDSVSSPKHYSEGTYPADFTSGKQVLYYSNYLQPQSGLFSYNNTTNKERELIHFSHHLYSNPILSPDNSKIAYYMATSEKENAPYDLWIYDLAQKKQHKYLSNVSLFPGYIHDPLWTKDSQSLFVSLFENQINRLYHLDFNGNKTLLGKNYDGNVIWPAVLSEKYIAFKTAATCNLAFHLACEDKIYPDAHTLGFIDLMNNNAFFLKTSDDPEFTNLLETSGNKVWAVGRGNLITSLQEPVDDPTDSPSIIGFNELDLVKKTVQSVPLPSPIKTTIGHRIQSIKSCGDYILTGKVGILPGPEEGYVMYYSYNPHDRSMKPFTDAMPFLDKRQEALCGFNHHDQKVYAVDMRDPSILLDVKEMPLSNPNKIVEKDYTDLLPEEIKQGLSDKCTFASLRNADSLGGNDVIYVSFNSSPDENCAARTKSINGIYRLSKQENKITKIAEDRDNQLLLVPNTSFGELD